MSDDKKREKEELTLSEALIIDDSNTVRMRVTNMLQERGFKCTTAVDGEDGILGGHENFVGALETGVLKFVHSGNDYWFMVSTGVFEVRGGEVSVLADVAEEAAEVDLEASKSSLEELEEKVSKLSFYSAEYKRAKVECDRAKARLEVHRRTQLN